MAAFERNDSWQPFSGNVLKIILRYNEKGHVHKILKSEKLHFKWIEKLKVIDKDHLHQDQE